MCSSLERQLKTYKADYSLDHGQVNINLIGSITMSVQKYIATKEDPGYTTIPNHIIKGLKKECELLGFYLYLLSQPTNWVFYKTQLKESCGLGVKKLDRFLRRLAQLNLVEIAQMRTNTGEFAHFSLRILNGSSFKFKELTPYVKNGSTVNGRTGLGSYKEKIIEIKDKQKKKKQKLLSATVVAQSPSTDFSFFDEFWKIYPRKKDKARTKEIWRRRKYDEIAPLIFEDIQKRMGNDPQWRDHQFIPHPSTYLSNRRFEDEIDLVKTQPRKETNAERVMRMCLN